MKDFVSSAVERLKADPNAKLVTFKVNGADLERLIILGGDLEYLRDLPRDRLPSHTEVRLAAGVLRRILVDNGGELSAFWGPMIGKTAHIQPTVEATEIDSALAEWRTEWIRYAFAGGATTQLAGHTGMILAVIPKADHELYGSAEATLAAHPMPMTGEKRLLTVGAWLDSTSVAIKTDEMGLVRVSRRSVVKYIANRKGGVHFDPRRDLTLKNEKHRREVVEHHLLDHGLLRIGHLSGPEYEVVSMAQAVGRSDWAEQFIEIAHNAAPEEFGGDPHELKFWTGLPEADGTGWATQRFEPKVEERPSA